MSEQRVATPHRRTLAEVRALWEDADTAEFRDGLRQARIEQEFGAFVYRLRTSVGMSRITLGKRIGMTGGEVQGMEEGGVSPTLDLADRVAAALGLRLRLVAEREAAQIGVMEVTAADG